MKQYKRLNNMDVIWGQKDTGYDFGGYKDVTRGNICPQKGIDELT